MTLETGFARLTANTQKFLNCCPAVKIWEKVVGDYAGCNDYVKFFYDPSVEVAIVPQGVWFSDREQGNMTGEDVRALGVAMEDEDASVARYEAAKAHLAKRQQERDVAMVALDYDVGDA